MASLAFALLGLPTFVAAAKPHVLFILADDYGWGNLGVHRRDAGSSPEEIQGKAEVHTPNIDALIDAGIHLDRHYTYKICSPTRSSIQSGRMAVHVNPINSAVTSQNYDDPVSGYAGIPRNMTGIAEKMRDAGYRTHLVGKWDAGMATPEHSPKGRGYETWYGYYQHANDYWHKSTVFFATGEVDACLNHIKDLSMHNATYSGPVRDDESLTAACEQDEETDPACYEEHLFKERVLDIIQKHDVSSPLFLFYSFHLIHTPLQVPKAWLHKIDDLVKASGGKPIDDENRRLYAAMTLYMDSAIGEAVEALKKKNMYDNTLIIFTSDNGGPIYEPGAASNHPLRGGKYNDWEGGIRTNAFVSGGFVPVERRGKRFEGIINVADWYGTLTELVGVDMKDSKSEAANSWLKEKGLPLLPPVDSVPQWQYIINDKNGRPDPMHLSSKAVLMWPYKLVTGKQPLSAWVGPNYPNCSGTVKSILEHNGPLPAPDDMKVFGESIPLADTPEEQDRQTWTMDCGTGCLVNVMDDPTEHVNLASDPKYASILSKMQEILKEMNKDLFNPDRGIDRVEACDVAIQQDRTFGPFVSAQHFYSPAPEKSYAQQLKDGVLSATLHTLNSDKVKPGFVSVLKKVGTKALQNMKSDKCLVPSREAVQDQFTVWEGRCQSCCNPTQSWVVFFWLYSSSFEIKKKAAIGEGVASQHRSSANGMFFVEWIYIEHVWHLTPCSRRRLWFPSARYGWRGGYDWTMTWPKVWSGLEFVPLEDVYVNQSALLDRGVTELKSGDKVQFLRLEIRIWGFDWILVVTSCDNPQSRTVLREDAMGWEDVVEEIIEFWQRVGSSKKLNATPAGEMMARLGLASASGFSVILKKSITFPDRAVASSRPRTCLGCSVENIVFMSARE